MTTPEDQAATIAELWAELKRIEQAALDSAHQATVAERALVERDALILEQQPLTNEIGNLQQKLEEMTASHAGTINALSEIRIYAEAGSKPWKIACAALSYRPASARLAADVLTALGKTKDPQLPDDEHMFCITFNSEADLDAFDAAVAAWRAGRT